jgi:hypothetical protein
MTISNRVSLVVVLIAVWSSSWYCNAMSETERVAEHDKRYDRTWPPAKYIPDTPGWKQLMDERFQQVAEIDNLNRRYEGYMQVRYCNTKNNNCSN